MADDMEVKFGADIGPLEAGTQSASEVIERATASWTQKFQSMFSSVSDSAKQMTNNVAVSAQQSTEKLEGFNKSIQKVHSTMMLLAEVAAFGWIGDKIWEMAKKTAEYAHEIELASQKTGMSTDALQGWGAAASMAGGSVEAVTKGVRKLSQEIVHAEEGQKSSIDAFKKIGIAAENLKGMKMDEIMLKVADSFHAHADGANKAALAQQLLGRAAQSLIPLFNMGREGVEQYLKVAKEMGAVMSTEDVEAAALFEQHLKLLHLTTEGLERKISMAMLPALAGLTSSFQKAVQPGGQLNGLLSLMPGALNTVAKIASYAAEGIELLGKRIAATAAIAYEFIHGNLKNANAIKDEFNKDFEQITKSAEAFRASLEHPVKLPKIIPGDGESDTKKPDFDTATPKAAKPDKSRLEAWRQQLEEQKELTTKYLEDDKASDLAFWQEKLSLTKAHSQEWLAVSREIYNLKKGMAQEDYNAELNGLKDSYALAQKGSLERINIVRAESALIKTTLGERSREYQASLKEIDKAQKEFSDEQDKDEKERALEKVDRTKEMALLDLDIQAQRDKKKKALRDISSDEEIADLLQLEQKKYIVELQALNDQEKLYEGDVKNYEKTASKIEELAKRHELAMEKIQTQAVKKNPWDKAFNEMSSSFNHAMETIIFGTGKMSKRLQQAWSQLAQHWAGMVFKMAEEWIANQLKILIFGKTADAVTTASKTAAAAEQTAAQSTADVSSAESLTAVAAIGAAASVASIPYVGPVLAAAAAASMEAMGQGYAAQAAAEGGYDVPAGVSPVTQLHPEEMVLPQHLAKPMRSMLKKGGGQEGGGAGGDVHIHAMDAKSFKQFLTGNKKAVQGLKRNFSFVGAK